MFFWGVGLFSLVPKLKFQLIFFLSLFLALGSWNVKVNLKYLAVVYFGRKSRWQVSECKLPCVFVPFCFYACLFFLGGLQGLLQQSRSLEKLLPGSWDKVQTYSLSKSNFWKFRVQEHKKGLWWLLNNCWINEYIFFLLNRAAFGCQRCFLGK